MAVSYVDTSAGSSGAATSASFATSLPAGWAAGDVAVLSAHVSGGSLTITTPAGWTLIPGVTWPVTEGSGSRLYVWYRVLQGGDTAPTLTNSGSVTGGWECQAFRGANAASPIGQANTSTASATSINLPTLTGVLAGSALAASVHARVASGTIPTGIDTNVAYTETIDQATSRATGNANVRMSASYRLIGSAGSYGGEAFPVTNAITSSMIAALVEVVPGTTQVTASITTGWAVASEVGGARSTGWAVAGQVSKSTVTAWATAAPVAASTATGWATSAEVAASTETGWSTAATAAAATSTVWSVASTGAADTTTSWQVLAPVTATTATSWTTHAQAAADTATTWAVDGALTPAARGTVRRPTTSALAVPARSEVTVR